MDDDGETDQDMTDLLLLTDSPTRAAMAALRRPRSFVAGIVTTRSNRLGALLDDLSIFNPDLSPSFVFVVIAFTFRARLPFHPKLRRHADSLTRPDIQLHQILNIILVFIYTLQLLQEILRQRVKSPARIKLNALGIRL